MLLNQDIQIRLPKAEGEEPMMFTGQESVEELREMIIRFSMKCVASPGHNNVSSPFRILSGPSYASLTSFVQRIPRNACVRLIEDELVCRFQAKATKSDNLVIC